MSTSQNHELQKICESIANAFESDGYPFLQEAEALGMAPVEHYVTVGERKGAFPSKDFDPVFYGAQNPDVVRRGYNLFWHYITFGKREGRPGALPTLTMMLPTERLDSSKEVLFVILHEATRTGAPILGWNIIRGLAARYNVVAIVMQGGSILDALKEVATQVVELPSGVGQDSSSWSSIAKQLKAIYNPCFAIANSSATHRLAVALEGVSVPVIALIHEFASDMPPLGVLDGLYQSASRIVFPALVVEDSSRECYPLLRGRPSLIVPQGPSEVPVFGETAAVQCGWEGMCEINGSIDGTFIVLGAGTVTYRKGVDVFVSVADFLINTLKRRNVRFIWLGAINASEARYKSALDLQVKRCGLAGFVEFAGEVDSLDEFLERADLFFLSSRIDPLPNVGIDAAMKGVPIVCFDGASGFSEILASDPATSSLVASYANVFQAASIIDRLIGEPRELHAASQCLTARASELFDMSRYIETLEALGRDAVNDMKIAEADVEEIMLAELFDRRFCFGDSGELMDEASAVERYVAASRRSWPLARPFTGTFVRRPLPGFNPLIYDMHNAPGGMTEREPFADFLANGQPRGPWLHKVIRPEDDYTIPNVKIALHGHFHYPELLEEFLDALRANELQPDLFLTSTSPEKVGEIKSVLRRRGLSAAKVWEVPNKGRDIFSFIRHMPAQLGGAYDIVGHVHGKKSGHVSSETGNRWRDFAWQHLLGDKFAMIDRIAGAFARNADVGLVFPEDPHLNGWDFNELIATDLARRMDVETPLPIHFDFPIGTMFWARPEALQPLFDLQLTMDEIPEEPLPIDGTILHAIERIIPFAVGKAGYSYATTHVPGVCR